MADWLRVGDDGSVAAEEGAPAKLAARPGRYAILPSQPDLLVAARLPAQGGGLPLGRVLVAGDLGGLPFPNLVNLLVHERKTGVLRVLAPSGDRTLVFSNGELRGASSTHPGDRLGEVMVRLGLVSRPDLDRVLAEPAAGRRLGRLLVERKLLSSHDLWKAIQEQVASIFNAMLLEPDAPFLFTDEGVAAAASAPGLSAHGLLMDGLRRVDELALFRSRVPSSFVQVSMVAAPASQLEPTQLEILLVLQQGPSTPAELARTLRMPEFDVTKQLYHLVQELGAVAVGPDVREAAALAPATPAPPGAVTPGTSWSPGPGPHSPGPTGRQAVSPPPGGPGTTSAVPSAAFALPPGPRGPVAPRKPAFAAEPRMAIGVPAGGFDGSSVPGRTAPPPGAPQTFAEVRPQLTAHHSIVGIFNQIFREIFGEAHRAGVYLELAASAQQALLGDPRHLVLFDGISFDTEGHLPVDQLLARLPGAAAAASSEPRELLLGGLQAAMFFLLFAIGEHLDRAADEELNRRVKHLFGLLERGG